MVILPDGLVVREIIEVEVNRGFYGCGASFLSFFWLLGWVKIWATRPCCCLTGQP